MKEWYTRKEVAELLGVSKATVYHYAKQKKIIKIEDPHRMIREARYRKKEVDQLAEERKRNEPTGLRPSELANELGVPIQRIYTLIQETDLPIEQLPSGDERTVYSISEEAAAWMRDEVKRTAPARGTRLEFYDATHDVALYQLYRTKDGQTSRALRNEAGEWGFYIQSSIWVPLTTALEMHQYEPAYSIHQETMPIRGYTDLSLPKDLPMSYLFLDFVYEVWGIENIRLRERKERIELSIKSGEVSLSDSVPESITQGLVNEFLVKGEILCEEDRWVLVSGYRRTTFELPSTTLNKLRKVSKENDMTMSEYIEYVLEYALENEE